MAFQNFRDGVITCKQNHIDNGVLELLGYTK